MEAINNLFTSLLNIGTGVGGTVAAFYLMVGAYKYMIAGGSPHQMEQGKTAMHNALFGFAIVLAAGLIVGVVPSSLGITA